MNSIVVIEKLISYTDSIMVIELGNIVHRSFYTQYGLVISFSIPLLNLVLTLDL